MRENVDRRDYLKTIGGLAAGLAIGGAAGWLGKPPVTITETVTETVTGPTPFEPSGTINVLMGAFAEGMFGPLIDAYRAAYPKVEVNISWVDYDSVRDKFTLAASQETGEFDLGQLDDPWFGFLSKYIVPVEEWPLQDELQSPEFGYDDFLGGALKMAFWEDKQWALPIRTGARMLFYRKDLYAEHEIEAPPPNEPWGTWEDDMLPILQTLTEDLDGDGTTDRYGFGCMWAPGYILPYEWAITFLYNWGGKFFGWEEGKPYVAFNSDEAVASLQFWVDLIHEYKVVHPAGDTWLSGELQEAYSEGLHAVMHAYTPYAARVEDASWSKVAGKIGYAVGPTGPTGITTNVAGGWSLGIPKGAPNPETAAHFAMYMTSKPVQVAMAKLGNGPTRASSLEHPDILELWSWAPTIGATMEMAEVMPKMPLWSEADLVIADSLSEALHKLKTPKQALDEAAAGVEEMIAEAYA